MLKTVDRAVTTTMDMEPYLSPAHGLVGVQGSPLQIRGIASVEVELAKGKFSSHVTVDSLTYDAILGKDFLKFNECVIDVRRNILHFETQDITLSLNSPA